MSGSEMKAAAEPPVQAGCNPSPRWSVRCEGLRALSSDWDLGFLGRELFSLALETPIVKSKLNYCFTELGYRSFEEDYIQSFNYRVLYFVST